MAAFFIAFKDISSVKNVPDLFANTIFRDIVLSISATLGLYILASLIFVSLRASKSLRAALNEI
jgi:chitin synthase